MTKPQKIAIVAGRGYYLGPNRNAPAMRLNDAKAAFKTLDGLKADRDAEIAYSMATGFGDHAKIARLDAEISRMEG